MSDEARIYSFHVGHGDCTLLEFRQAGIVRFRMLVDAGSTLPSALIDHLRADSRQDVEFDLDAVVLSHVDADHQGGLPALLTQGIRVREYLGPSLPTFRRLSWLFAPRVQESVERAEEVERQLRQLRIPIIYPLEGYLDRFVGGRVVLTVLSPAARLLEKLSLDSGGELSNLLMRSPLPLQWLLEPSSSPPYEDPWRELRARFRTGVHLQPEDFPDGMPATPGIDPNSMQAAARTLQQHFDPEFFGNAILNDTSLVLAVDFHLDGVHRRRILLTGDQENWSYIAAMHPGGLGVDVLKAPHHGGSLYLDDNQEALVRVYAWMRPRSVLVSASGRYDLPRTGFRDALRTVGACLLCPNARSIEPLTAGAQVIPSARSCFKAFECSPPAPHSQPTVVTLTAAQEIVNSRACVQGAGHGGTAPIVVLQQNVISPSEAFVRWTRRELTRHAHWIQGQLNNIHLEFLKQCSAKSSISAAVAQLPAEWDTLAARARHARRHDLVADPQPVLRFGSAQALFWVCSELYGAEPRFLYRLPSAAELSEVRQWLRSIPNILGHVTLTERSLATADKIAILRATDWPVLRALIAARLHVPRELVSAELLPALQVVLSEQFEAQISWSKYPDRIPTGGEVMLLLVNKERRIPMPNLPDDQWQGAAAVRTYWSASEQIWQALDKGAAQSVLLADRLEEDKDGNWHTTRGWFERMGLDEYRNQDRFQAFRERPWHTLWT